MRYESPELTALTPAIDGIQALKFNIQVPDNELVENPIAAYEDWE